MKYIVIILLISLSIPSHGRVRGKAYIDSLELELPKSIADTNKVNLLRNLSFAYRANDTKKGIEYGEEGLKLSKKLNYKFGELGSINSIGINYAFSSNFKEAGSYFQQALELSEKLENNDGIALALNNLGNINNSLGDYEKALDYFQKSLEFKTKHGISNIASTHMSIGNLYKKQGEYVKALEYYQNALKGYEEKGNKTGIANCQANIGNVYRKRGDDSTALDYYERALIEFKSLGKKKALGTMLGNIGLIYHERSDNAKALDYLLQSLKIKEDFGDKLGMSTTYNNIGAIYYDQSNAKKTLEYYFKSLELSRELGDRDGTALSLGNIGGLYWALSLESVIINPDDVNEYISIDKRVNLNKSIKYLTESTAIQEELGILHTLSTNLKTLSDAYSLKKDYENAYKTHLKHKRIQDSVFNENKSIEIGRLEAKREQIEAEYAQQETDRLLQEKIERRNTIQYSIISIVTLIIFAVIFYFIRRNVNFGAVDTLTFVAFLLLYEFILVITEPWVDDWTNNVPIYKLLFNIAFALILIPLQKLEQKIKSRLEKS